MDVQPFGECDRGPVQRVVVGSPDGVQLEVLDLGATVHRLFVVGGDGVRRNVLLGHPTAQDHLDQPYFLGGSIGRYANRIAGGRFAIDGHEHQVGAHDRGNSLHGGPDGFDRRIWDLTGGDEDHVVLRLTSPDGDQGFPGTVEAEARFTVLEDGVRIDFSATTDAATPVNLTSHAYFNLDGEGSGTAENHVLRVDADDYLPVDDTGIPLDGLHPVAGTSFDLRSSAAVASVVRSGEGQVRSNKGVDHSFAIRGDGLRPAAVLESARTRTRLTLHADQPALQVYTGNFLDGTVPGTSGGLYRQGDGIALEPQLFPDTPNRPALGDATLRRGDRYTATLEWRFSTTEES